MNQKIKNTILFVDDEPQEVKYFDRAFGKEFDILLANNVDQAIELIEEYHQKIAVVITDQRMPEKTGLDLLSYVYKNHTDIVRILTTAYCDTKSAIEAINSTQVFRYIAKPWNIDALHQSLDQALAQCFLQTQHNETQILSSLDEDCSHWYTYSMHAHRDEFVYRSGLEALVCQYNQRVDNNINPKIGKKIKQKINALIIEKYITEHVLRQVQMQNNQTFSH